MRKSMKSPGCPTSAISPQHRRPNIRIRARAKSSYEESSGVPEEDDEAIISNFRRSAIQIDAVGRPPFWMTLAVTQGIAWLLFGSASLLVPHTWQQKAGKTSTRGWVYAWKYGGTKRRSVIRRKLLDRDAIIWLVCRERWQSLGIWIITLVLIASFITAAVGLPDEAWTAAHVDEDWNMGFWGRDEQAADRRAFRRREFDAAALVLAALRA